MFSHFTKTCQRVSLRGLWKTATANTYKHVRSNASVGDWDADKYSKDATFIFKDSAALLDLLNPRPSSLSTTRACLANTRLHIFSGERILDLGCGSGELTMVLKDAGSEVVAVDVSPAMVEVAKAKGERNTIIHV